VIGPNTYAIAPAVFLFKPVPDFVAISITPSFYEIPISMISKVARLVKARKVKKVSFDPP
jgi:hypothetical protein